MLNIDCLTLIVLTWNVSCGMFHSDCLIWNVSHGMFNVECLVLIVWYGTFNMESLMSDVVKVLCRQKIDRISHFRQNANDSSPTQTWITSVAPPWFIIDGYDKIIREIQKWILKFQSESWDFRIDLETSELIFWHFRVRFEISECHVEIRSQDWDFRVSCWDFNSRSCSRRWSCTRAPRSGRWCGQLRESLRCRWPRCYRYTTGAVRSC